MPTKCQVCGKYDYVIYITKKYAKICPECYRKSEACESDNTMDSELDKYTKRQTRG